MSADDRDRPIRELNKVRFVVLRTCDRQRPDPAIKIDLVPTHPCDLVSALPSQGEDLDDRSVGPLN